MCGAALPVHWRSPSTVLNYIIFYTFQPQVVLSFALGIFGLAAGALGPPLRRSLGYSTGAYYGAATTARQVADAADAQARQVAARAGQEARARKNEHATETFWVKGDVGGIPTLVRSSDVEGGHVVRKSSVIIKE